MRQKFKQRQSTVERTDHWDQRSLVPDDIATRVIATSRRTNLPLSPSIGTATNRTFVIESFGTFDSIRHSHKKPSLGSLRVRGKREREKEREREKPCACADACNCRCARSCIGRNLDPRHARVDLKVHRSRCNVHVTQNLRNHVSSSPLPPLPPGILPLPRFRRRIAPCNLAVPRVCVRVCVCLSRDTCPISRRNLA